MLTLVPLWLACGDPSSSDSGVTEAEADTDADADTDTDTDTDTDPHEIGRDLPGFALVDINPSSATYGEIVSSEDLDGSTYALIFLDSRCLACGEVVVDLWAEFQEHPAWWEGLPTFAVQSVGGGQAPETLDNMIEGHDMPYLQDTEDTALWRDYEALNHDLYAVSEEGTLDAWLPLYSWPDDLVVFTDYMTDRFGP